MLRQVTIEKHVFIFENMFLKIETRLVFQALIQSTPRQQSPTPALVSLFLGSARRLIVSLALASE